MGFPALDLSWLHTSYYLQPIKYLQTSELKVNENCGTCSSVRCNIVLANGKSSVPSTLQISWPFTEPALEDLVMTTRYCPARRRIVPTIPEIGLLRAVVGITFWLSTRVTSWFKRSIDSIFAVLLLGSMKKWSEVSCLEQLKTWMVVTYRY